MLGYMADARVSGLLVEDPAEKVSKDGKKIFCSFRVLVVKRYKDSSEDMKSILPVFCFDDDLSKLILLNFRKGSPIFFTGDLNYKKNPKTGNMMFNIFMSSSHTLTPIEEIKKRSSEYIQGLSDEPTIQDDELPF